MVHVSWTVNLMESELKEFTAEGEKYIVNYVYSNNAGSIKLTKPFKPALQTNGATNFQFSSMQEKKPRNVMASKNGADKKEMVFLKALNQWGPVSWDLEKPKAEPAASGQRTAFGHTSLTFGQPVMDMEKQKTHFEVTLIHSAVGYSFIKYLFIILQIFMDFGPPSKKGEENILQHLSRLVDNPIKGDVEFIVKGEKIVGHELILQGLMFISVYLSQSFI